MFNSYGLTEAEVKEKVVIVTDRGPNIKYGLIKAGFKRLTCYAHILHNLVCAMLEDPIAKKLVQKANELSAYVKNSGMNTKLQTSLKTYTKTRWNSVFIMINAIINNYEIVYDLLMEKQRIVNEEKIKRRKQPNNDISELITTLNRSELIEMRDFLEPFKVNI